MSSVLKLPTKLSAMPSGSGWLRARRSSRIAAFSSKVGVEVGVGEAGAWGSERGLGEADVREPGDLLRRGPKDLCGDVAEIPELGVNDRHGLLAQAAERLAMFLGDAPDSLGALVVRAREPARELGSLRLRRSGFRADVGLWLRSTHSNDCSLASASLPAQWRGLYPFIEFSPAPVT